MVEAAGLQHAPRLATFIPYAEVIDMQRMHLKIQGKLLSFSEHPLTTSHYRAGWQLVRLVVEPSE